MNAGNDRKPLRRTIRGGRSFFFSDPAIDKVLNMVVTLGSEVWALRERLAAVEAIQVQRGHLVGDEVDGYEFTAEQETRLAADRKEFIDNLFRILQEQVERAAAKPAKASDKPSGRPALFGARGAKEKSTAATSRGKMVAGRPRAKSAGARSRPAAKPGVTGMRRPSRR